MNKIELQRESKGLTQSELSKKAGIDRSNLSEYENGKGNPTIRTLKKLATALGCEVKDLI